MDANKSSFSDSDIDEFLKRYESGERDFNKVNLYQADLNGQDLRGVKLTSANLHNAQLFGADLRGAQLDKTDLSCAFLCGADLRGIKIVYGDMVLTNCCGADLRGAYLACSNLKSASFIGADLRGAFLRELNLENVWFDMADLRVDHASMELNLSNVSMRGTNITGIEDKIIQMDGEILIDAIDDVSILPNIEALTNQHVIKSKISVNNQGIPFDINSKIYTWKTLRFRSKVEIKIAEALDQTGVLFLPNCLARLNDPRTPQGRGNKEADFLICHQGKWGILEVDGPYHKPERRVDEQERERLFRHYGIRVIERFDSSRCQKQPQEVVREFLQILEKMHQL
ncbi:pentapeptide repeat-containing protein [Calothrix sp. FACHB-1219]|uniref:pentapeptide repeat-containing protein n=1 Tax=unclassified Calothrix TaxID=2619626 RepID=UPI0016872755|nr:MULTISPECIES: pentapeptide repeat-containing protein [unclassified Calothrix]MBD2207826.1 pentapeptide repeat-containing protein [Calothrix sp. FACHB-168]MBD2222438.1 pentapeptide repeat-containing protein [Calothrix sp. FACHB-1219]